MRAAFHNGSLRRLLLVWAVLWGVPFVPRGLPSPTARATDPALRSGPVLLLSDHAGGGQGDVAAPSSPAILAAAKVRGGPLVPPLARLALLPPLAWLATERPPVPFHPPADHLPPSARPLLAALPDRAPPTV